VIALLRETCYTATMKLGTGKIIEIMQSSRGRRQAVLQLEGITQPAPGQYLQTHRPQDEDKPAGVTLFPGGIASHGLPPDQLTTAPPVPADWQPGDLLQVRGPLGKGFHIPANVRRLALCAFGEVSDHLLPLAGTILAQDGEVALFTDGDFSQLPARIEVNPLADLADACKWADLMACAAPVDQFSAAQEQLERWSPIGCETQLLVYSQYPCAAMAECGVCAFRVRSGQTRLACQDGPVFDWREI